MYFNVFRNIFNVCYAPFRNTWLQSNTIKVPSDLNIYEFIDDKE